MRRVAIASFALFMLLSGCGGPGASRGAKESSPSGRNTQGTPSKATSDPHTYSIGQADRRGSASPTPYSGPVLTPGPDGKYHIPDFVHAEVHDYESWEGPTCAPPRAGSLCGAHFRGSTYTNDEKNALFLLVFENDRTAPTQVGGPIPQKKEWNKIDFVMWWRITPGTKRVVFRAELRDPNNKVIASSQPSKFFVNA